MIKPKKAQLYGINAFIYAIAIAIILIVSIVGISKDFEAASQAGFFRFGSIAATKNAEMIKKLFDQERGYTIDKSLFFTAAYGGYSAIDDFICSDTSCCLGDGSCDLSKAGCTLKICYPNIDSGGGQCGAKTVGLSYLGEKRIPYWNSLGIQCIPDINTMMDTFETYAGTFFAAPSESVLVALTAGTFYPVSFNYNMDFDKTRDVDSTNGIIQTKWLTVGSTKMLKISAPPENPVVEYSFQPYLHLYSKTEFFDIYEEAKSSVENKYFEAYLSNYSLSPIPRIIDIDKSVLKHPNTGVISSCKCSTDQFDSNGDNTTDTLIGYGETCTMNTSLCMPVRQDFKALINYINSNPILYPNIPNVCAMPALADVDNTYVGGCKLTTINSDGNLIVDQFSQGCAGNNTNDNAMKCVFTRIINRMNNEIMSKPVRKNVASAEWGATIAGTYVETLYNKRLSHVIDSKNDENSYDNAYGYGYTTIASGEVMKITFAKEYDIDTLKLYLWNKDTRYYQYKIEGSLDDVKWIMLVDATTGEHRGMEQWDITPISVKYLRINGTYSGTDTYFRVVELEAFSDIDFRHTIFSFNLSYTGSNVGYKFYNATDLDSNGDAPTSVVTPDPLICGNATCSIKEYCYNFTGESCPCCGERGDHATNFGGPGLRCCTAVNAHSSYISKCWDDGCVGKVILSAGQTAPQKCSSTTITASGFCQNCTSKTVAFYDNGVFNSSSVNILLDGSVTKTLSFATTGIHTITGKVDMNNNGLIETNEIATVDVQVTACGENGEVPCAVGCIAGYVQVSSGGYCNPSFPYNPSTTRCEQCGLENAGCCPSGPQCTGTDLYCSTLGKCQKCLWYNGHDLFEPCCFRSDGTNFCPSSNVCDGSICRAAKPIVTASWPSDCSCKTTGGYSSSGGKCTFSGVIEAYVTLWENCPDNYCDSECPVYNFNLGGCTTCRLYISRFPLTNISFSKSAAISICGLINEPCCNPYYYYQQCEDGLVCANIGVDYKVLGICTLPNLYTGTNCGNGTCFAPETPAIIDPFDLSISCLWDCGVGSGEHD